MHPRVECADYFLHGPKQEIRAALRGADREGLLQVLMEWKLQGSMPCDARMRECPMFMVR